MKFSRRAAYGLQATLYLAEANSRDPIPCNRIAARGRIPERFLLQVLRSLVNAGILRSTRGIGGGYALDRDPEDISLLDIIEAVHETVDAQLPLTKHVPKALQRRIKSALADVTAVTRQQCEAIKIAQLLPPPKK